MKKKVIRLDNTLSLDKETISRLNEEQLGQIEGGLGGPYTASCNNIVQQTYVSCEACSCNGEVCVGSTL